MLPAIPTPIPMPFAQNGERRAIPETNTVPGSADASWATGFPPVTRINKQAGGKPPYGLDFQGIFHTICEHLFFSQSGNTVPWVGASDGEPGLNYFKGAIVQGSDGETYMALKPSGPDTPNPDGGGMVGPVDPVGDESGHWINLILLFAGSPNNETWLTESGTFTAPVTGTYEVLCIGGGQGGYQSDQAVQGGDSGALSWGFVRLIAGQEYPVTIGAGGTPGTIGLAAGLGGKTSFAPELFENKTPVYPTAMEDIGRSQISFRGTFHRTVGFTTGGVYVYGAGLGGGVGGTSSLTAGHFFGAGGGAYYSLENSSLRIAGYGAQGAVRLRWHDPAKAAGPLPEPAFFAARRMPASRAASAPATVNLYDPETGQGSVWRAEDAEAKLAEGLISEEAWLAICAAKAAEEYAEWLASPDTESERFDLLRAARDAKLSATDYLVAPDYPLTDEQRAAVTSYRQALRDLPAQEGAPWDGGGELTPWPEMPAVKKAQEEE